MTKLQSDSFSRSFVNLLHFFGPYSGRLIELQAISKYSSSVNRFSVRLKNVKYITLMSVRDFQRVN